MNIRWDFLILTTDSCSEINGIFEIKKNRDFFFLINLISQKERFALPPCVGVASHSTIVLLGRSVALVFVARFSAGPLFEHMAPR